MTIVPPYMAARARVGVIFAREIAEAQRHGHEWVAAQLLNLRDEVLAAIDPETVGGDESRD